KKPAESARFEQIIDFLKSKPIHYALTVNPTIYVSCVKQFWAMAKVKKVNDQQQIQALVDKKKVIITEDSIRSDLRFDDAKGTGCLLNEAIFEGLTRITMASVIICLANNQKFNFSKYIFDNMVKSLEGGVKFYLFLRFLIRACFSGVITPLFDTMIVQAPADMGDTPVKTHQTPIVDQSLTSKPQKTQIPRRKQRKEADISHDESEDEDHVLYEMDTQEKDKNKAQNDKTEHRLERSRKTKSFEAQKSKVKARGVFGLVCFCTRITVPSPKVPRIILADRRVSAANVDILMLLGFEQYVLLLLYNCAE
nr:hypothetical protein [Tanacetum cinerariifolium]